MNELFKAADLIRRFLKNEYNLELFEEGRAFVREVEEVEKNFVKIYQDIEDMNETN